MASDNSQLHSDISPGLSPDDGSRWQSAIFRPGRGAPRCLIDCRHFMSKCLSNFIQLHQLQRITGRVHGGAGLGESGRLNNAPPIKDVHSLAPKAYMKCAPHAFPPLYLASHPVSHSINCFFNHSTVPSRSICVVASGTISSYG